MEEEVLFEHDACHVFRLPPTGYLSSALWEGNHIWTGKVQVLRRWRDNTPTHSVELVDTATHELFGQCPLKETSGSGIGDAFQVASDSSRCFVIRVEQGDQFANVGLNFEDKAVAFRFCTTVLERNKRLHLLHVSDMPGEAISRYGNVHAVERRAQGKIEVQLSGKLAPHVPTTGSAASVSAGTKDANFSLHAIPKSNSAVSSRRIVCGNTTASGANATTPAAAPRPPAPAASKASATFDPFGGFPEPVSTSSTGGPTTPAVVLPPSSESPPVASSGPQPQQQRQASVIDSPFDGIDTLSISRGGGTQAPIPTASSTKRGLDDYFS